MQSKIEQSFQTAGSSHHLRPTSYIQGWADGLSCVFKPKIALKLVIEVGSCCIVTVQGWRCSRPAIDSSRPSEHIGCMNNMQRVEMKVKQRRCSISLSLCDQIFNVGVQLIVTADLNVLSNKINMKKGINVKLQKKNNTICFR